MSDLPDSWSRPSLGDVIDIQGGSQPPKKYFIEKPKAGYVRMLQIRDFKNDNNPVYIPKDKAKRWCEVDDLLIGRYGASVGRICTGNSGSYNVALAKVIFPRNHIDRLWIEYYLRAPEFQRNITTLGGRAAQAGFNKNDLASMNFPVPPLSEQKRIVNKIETCFKKVDATDEALNKAEVLIGKYKEALLAKAFRGELVPQDPNDEPASQLLERIRTEREQADTGKKCKKKTEFTLITDDEKPFDIPDSWQWVRLEDLFSVQTGATPKRDNQIYYRNGKIPYVKTGLVQNCEIHSSDEFITEQAVAETNVKVFPVDTILVAMYGEGKTRGQTGILKIEAGTNQACAALVNTQLDSTLREYVLEWLKFRYGVLRDKAEGGNQLNLNLEKVKKFVMPLPSTRQVETITKKIGTHQAQINALETNLEEVRSHIKMEQASVLANAFQGKLVDQIESEGTGHQLLEEILTEKAKIEAAKSKKKKTSKKAKKKTRKKKS